MKIELLAITPNAEKLIELAGRTAYASQSRRRKDSQKAFIRMLLKNEHLSVFEHASATFRVKGVSRALTHQLVRHRLASFIQRSQRYVDEEGCGFVAPETVRRNAKALKIYVDFMKHARKTYGLLRGLGLRKEDARFVLPNAAESEIVVTANFREWRHIISIRGDRAAQWEIRELIIRILAVLRKKAPDVFSDFSVDRKLNCVVKA